MFCYQKNTLGLLLLILTAVVCSVLAKELCEEDPKFKAYAHEHLKKLEADFHTTKTKAESRERELKRQGGSQLEDFEKEYHNFVANYQALMQLMDAKPSFCERVIGELEHAIKYFNEHFLPETVVPTTTTKY